MKSWKKFLIVSLSFLFVVTSVFAGLSNFGNANNNTSKNQSQNQESSVVTPTEPDKTYGGMVYYASEEEVSDAKATAKELKGGAVFVGSGTKVEVNGGSINYHEAEYGGAFYVEAGGVLEVNGGKIAYNGAKCGGAIYVEYGGKVIINGGVIEKNTAESGYAICVEPNPDGNSSNVEDLEASVVLGNGLSYEQVLVGNQFASYDNFRIEYYVDGALYEYSYKKVGAFWNYDLPLSYEECNGYFDDELLTDTLEEGDLFSSSNNVVKIYTRTATIDSLDFVGNDTGYTISPKATATGTLVIPREYNGLPVNKLSGFKSFKNEFELYVSANIQTLDSTAFAYSEIKRFNFTDALTKIETQAFLKSKIENVKFSYGLQTINASAFYGCNLITDIVIPGSVKLIESGAFQNCKNLTRFIMEEGVENVNSSVLSQCESVVEVSIPNSIGNKTSNYYYTFFYYAPIEKLSVNISTIPANMMPDDYKAKKLTELTIGDKVENIDSNAFSKKDLTTMKVDSENKTYKISSNSLLTIDGKTLVMGCCSSSTIPNGVENIGAYAFSGITELKEIQIPSSVKNIGSHAFAGCSGLTELTIPSNVLTIENSAFSNCKNIANLYYDNTNIDSFGSRDNGVFYGLGANTSCTVSFSDNVKKIPSYFSSKNGYGIKTIKFGNSLESIGDSAFYYCGITELNLQSINIKTIGKAVFAYNYDLTNVILGDNIESIGDSAFYYCNDLTNVTIGKGNTIFGTDVFKDLGISYLNINQETIPSKFFYWNKSLETLVIGDDVKNIEVHAFDTCTNLKNLTLGSGLVNIKHYAFSDCTSLSVDDAVIKIVDINKYSTVTFANAKSNPLYEAKNIYDKNGNLIENIVFNNNISIVNQYIFYSQYGIECLKSVTIGSACTKLGYQSFKNCKNLNLVNFSNSGNLESIAGETFGDCESLTNITLPSGLLKIYTGAFYGCNIKNVSIPASVTRVGRGAFGSAIESISFESSDDWKLVCETSDGTKYSFVDYNYDVSDSSYNATLSKMYKTYNNATEWPYGSSDTYPCFYYFEKNVDGEVENFVYVSIYSANESKHYSIYMNGVFDLAAVEAMMGEGYTYYLGDENGKILNDGDALTLNYHIYTEINDIALMSFLVYAEKI